MSDSLKDAYRAASKWKRVSVHAYVFLLAAAPVLVVGVPAMLLLGWTLRPLLAVTWIFATVVVYAFHVHVSVSGGTA